jgi:hypothetical protein
LNVNCFAGRHVSSRPHRRVFPPSGMVSPRFSLGNARLCGWFLRPEQFLELCLPGDVLAISLGWPRALIVLG